MRDRPSKRSTRCWLAALLALVAYLGLFASVSPLGFDVMDVEQPLTGWVRVGLYAGLFALIWSALGAPRGPRCLPWLSATVSFCVVLNRSFLKTDGWELWFGSFGAFLSGLWVWLALALALLAAMRSLYRAALGYMTAPEAPPASPRRHELLRTALLMLLCWLPHTILQFPGHIEWTAGDQLLQAYGLQPYMKECPLLHTLLLKVVIQGGQKLGVGDTAVVFLVSLSQMLPLAFGLAWTVRLVRAHAPRRGLATALKWFYCLCPLFPLFSTFIVKDVPFATATLYWVCLLFELRRDGEGFFRSWRLPAAYAVCGAVFCLLRGAAAVLFAFVSVLALIGLRKSSRELRRFAAATAAALAVYALFVCVAYPLANVSVRPNRLAENRSLQCQVVARIVKEHGEELAREERDTIAALLRYDELAERYNPELSDYVKDEWNGEATAAQVSAFDTLSARLALRYPATSLQAALAIALPYITPGDTGRFISLFGYGFSHIEDIRPYFDPDHWFPWRIANVPLAFIQREPLINFFCVCGFYSWLLIGGAALLAGAKRRRFLLCFLPGLGVLAGCFFSPVAGYLRYALPYAFSTPFLFCVALSELGWRAREAKAKQK